MTKLISTIKKNAGIDRLQPREKKVLLGGVSFLSCFFVFQSIIMPYFHARSELKDSIKKHESEIVDITLLSREYTSLNSRKDSIARLLQRRTPDFSLFSFLEEQSALVHIKDRVKYMKPSTNEIEGKFSESIVEMKIEKITLGQFVGLLESIEKEEKVVMIRKVIVQGSSQQNGMLDIILNVRSFELNNT